MPWRIINVTENVKEADSNIEILQEVIALATKRWLEDMKKYLPLILVALFGWVVVESFKQRFRILPNKKFASNSEYYENFNIFKCIHKCRKETDCKIFNYNSKQRICQITDERIDVDHQEATENHGWKVYIPILNQVNC